MGDRFEMTLKCAYCGIDNEVWYAPTCCSYDFTCRESNSNAISPDSILYSENKEHIDKGCGSINFICSDFSVVKAEEITEQMVIDGFEMATNAYHTPSAIRKVAKQYIRDLKKRIKQDIKNDRHNGNS